MSTLDNLKPGEPLRAPRKEETPKGNWKPKRDPECVSLNRQIHDEYTTYVKLCQQLNISPDLSEAKKLDSMATESSSPVMLQAVLRKMKDLVQGLSSSNDGTISV